MVRALVRKEDDTNTLVGIARYQYNNNLKLLDSSELFEPIEVAQQPPLRANILLFLPEENLETCPLRNIHTCLISLLGPISHSQKSAGPAREGEVIL